MPSTNQYDSRRSVYVQPFPNSPILYGFLTNCKAATSTACGHIAVDPANLPQNIVFGCNAPKPGRASRLNADEYDGSFYDWNNYAALKADGWRLSKPFVRLPKTTSRSLTVYASTNSTGTANGPIKYAWTMPISLYTKIEADLAGLGINLPNGDDIDLVWGLSAPKLPKVSKQVVGAGGVDNLSTQCAPSRLDNLPSGWATGGTSKTYIALG